MGMLRSRVSQQELLAACGRPDLDGAALECLKDLLEQEGLERDAPRRHGANSGA
jgi:hypothetical protein